jgi:hypothetical protein
MLVTILVLLLILWLLGAFIVPVGGAVHILLVVFIVIVIVRLIQGRPIL